MEDRAVDLKYPAFLVSPANDPNSALTVDAEGERWALLYGTLELAELYIEQAKIDYVPRPANERDLNAVLSADAGIAGFVWNPVIQPSWFQFIDRREFAAE